MQAQFREWLKTRDPKTWTEELRAWSSGHPRAVIQMAGAAEWFRGPISGGRLKALDTWMSVSAAEIDEYLPDGPAEINGYGRDRVGIAYSAPSTRFATQVGVSGAVKAETVFDTGRQLEWHVVLP